MQRFQLYDTTLRDGTQQQGMNPTVEDKLAVARVLDDLGVAFIEGGWPGAVPKDTEFFRRARRELRLRHAQLAAFGATRRPGESVAVDPQVRALLRAETPVVTLVAKSHPRHVEYALRTTLAENLAMIASTVRHLVQAGRRVFVDAEHYFDGYHLNREYGLEVVRIAAEAGAEAVVLCDTNGGSLPDGVRAVIQDTRVATGVPLGIHCHDDSGCAVANTLTAVDAGVRHAQVTAHGYGERCGNANLFTVAADLVLKRDVEVLPPQGMRRMAGAARAIEELTGVPGHAGAPYVGTSAFTHKAGLHASALRVDAGLYQHIDPERVGSRMRTLVSDMGGRSSVELKARELGFEVGAGSEAVARTAARIKERESEGCAFEAADASFELLLREELAGGPGALPEPFTVGTWQVGVENRSPGGTCTTASVRLTTSTGEPLDGVGEGTGPAEALHDALHRAADAHFPALTRLLLTGHRTKALDGTTRVVADFHDGDRGWSTVAVDRNPVAAFWRALVEAARYTLLDDTPRDTARDTARDTPPGARPGAPAGPATEAEAAGALVPAAAAIVT